MSINTRFEIDSLIGEGGMGEVYRVYDNDLKKICALKLSKYPDDENEFEQTVNEATLWFKFRKFAHVVEVYEIIRLEDSRIGILMEYMNGGNLRALISNEVSLNDKLLALFDISSAIINCNSLIPGFSHLDLKPENCLRTDFGLTKLSDFGLSCYVKSGVQRIFQNEQSIDSSLSLPIKTSHGIRCAGTPLYMAPEQIIELETDQQKSDVYSFGILAAELLSGVHPLQNIDDLNEIFRAHIQGISNKFIKFPENIPASLINLILKAVSPNPSNRPKLIEINELIKSLYGGPRLMMVTNLEKLSDSVEESSRKGKSLWAIGQHEAASSVLKSNLDTDPFQADLWYYLTKIEWENLNSVMSDLDLNQVINRSTKICAYAFRARVLDEKYSDQNHEDYQFINLILPQVAGQKYIEANDMDGYYRWGKEFLVEQNQWINQQHTKIVESGGPVRCLCVRCGEVKMHITKRCPRCGFLSTNMRDIYNTYLLRIEAVHFPNAKEDVPYWVKMNFLRNLGKKIQKTLSEISSDAEYLSRYKAFEQNEGKFLYQLIHFGGSKDEIENIKNFLRPKRKAELGDKIKRFFK